MCNDIHRESELVTPDHGIGYKYFSFDPLDTSVPRTYLSWFSSQPYIERDEEGFFPFQYDAPGDGFCFFLSLVEAFKAEREAKDYNTVLCKIEYREAVCKHIETEFVLIPVEMALCRKFRIIGEVPAK